jgi:hypothetical protein
LTFSGRSLKSAGEWDDNWGVTIVIALQGLAFTLAGLLLLEARLHRNEQDDRGTFDPSQAAGFDFHPELIVAWDDEADYARKRACTRPVRVDRRESRPLQPATSRPHQQLR